MLQADDVETLLKCVGDTAIAYHSQGDIERTQTGTQIRFQQMQCEWRLLCGRAIVQLLTLQ